MVQKKITLKDIAKELDVSVSTVSKALKNSQEISKDTKEKIKAFAKLYNYKPNHIAVSLKNRRTNNIAVVIPDIVHHFFTTVVRGIESEASNRGYHVIFCISNELHKKEVLNLQRLANGSIDGFILSLSAETEAKNDFGHLNEIIEQGFPIVLFDRVADEILCNKVVIDDELGGYMATKKLIEEGRQRIAIINTEDYFSVSRKRLQGYSNALNEKGMQPLILKLPYLNPQQKLLSDFILRHKPDALLSTNEAFAVFAQKVAQQMGLLVPTDVSIIGFTDGLLARHAMPDITSVDQHGELMGKYATKMLIDQIEAITPLPIQTKIFEPSLVLRGSTL